MLALTENVTEIVNKLAEEVPEMSGVRIATEPDGQALSVSPANAAIDGDQKIEQDGATVWLDPVAADALDGMVLDGGVDAEGNIQFALGQQA
jgi:iron-sulfur cluster assembly protein